MDPELRDLERAAAASPDDAGLHVRLARAFERAGDPIKAATALARVVDVAPGNADALRDLDRLTRGGVDPRAPWPAERGDGWRTGRSRVNGPGRGASTERYRVTADLERVRGFTVAADGSLALGVSHTLHASTDRSGDRLAMQRFAPDPRECGVFATEAERPRARSGRIPAPPSLLVGGRAGELTVPPFARAGREQVSPKLVIGAPWVAGLGHVAGVRGRQGIEVSSLADPSAVRWRAPVPRPPARLALAPPARLVVLTEGGLGARGSLHVFELATGNAVRAVALERVGLKAGVDLANVVASEDGWLYLGLGGSVAALAPDGSEAWRFPQPGEPAALAGAESEVLVVCDPRSFTPSALDARTGAELWRSRDACLNGLPKVDARGLIYWRREQELVWLDPRNGNTLGSALVGEHWWEFAFAGEGRAYALRSAVRGAPAELVVVE